MMSKWLKVNKKIFFQVFLGLVFLFTVTVLAEETLLEQKQNAISTGGNQESWLDEALTSNLVSGLKVTTGTIPKEVLQGKGTGWIPGGAIGATNQAIAMTFNPAASGVEYIAQTWNNFLGKPAYAQANTGFQGLQPILPIWRGFRNVVYILSSLVFIVIGIMIMFRMKISPQAVITVQNAIPQLITTLVLVTFSYAIAGLLIDFASLIQGIAISTLFASRGVSVNQNLLSQDIVQTFASSISQLFGGTYNTYNLHDLISNNGFLQTFNLVSRLVPFMTISIIGGIIGAIIAAIVTVSGGGLSFPIALAVGGGVSIILILIFAIIIFIKLLSFLFALIKVYVNVILKIIMAPLEIGLGAFPGSKQGFSSWAIGLIANLAVFPGCLLFLVFVNVIMETISGSGQMWTPQIMGVAGSIGGVAGGSFIAALFGFGAFMILTKLPELIPQAVFAIKPSAFDQAYSQATDMSRNPLWNFGKAAVGNIGSSLALSKAEQLAAKYNQKAQDRFNETGQGQAAAERAQKINTWVHRITKATEDTLVNTKVMSPRQGRK